jgi:deoxyribodipyrimidine photo-lyase
VIVWFRDDLRLADNPALREAAATGQPLCCIFILDEASEGLRPLGGAARWWLHGALTALDQSLAGAGRGGGLAVHRGRADELVPHLAEQCGASAVYWNRRYGAAERRIDEAVKTDLRGRGIDATSFNGHLLYEPWTLTTGAGGPYRVFSAFWRAAAKVGPPLRPLPAPKRLLFKQAATSRVAGALTPAELQLTPTAPDWAGGMRAAWRPGEDGAQQCLERFLDDAMPTYAAARDRPAQATTSRMSPYLRFGNISPRQVWHAAAAADAARSDAQAYRSFEKFQSELGWREFSYHLLFHNPDLASRNLQAKFDRMPWRSDTAALQAWQRGQTGYPLVDAGMRELWTTGWMHNRVRMVVASFLVKHLLIDWREGEAWFWDTLVDADPASNPASWQWVAGCGADAAPYFRIFNPVLQGEKFDPDGVYVKRWVPELAQLPAAVVHSPWEATPEQLRAAGVTLGENYPERVVEHQHARQRALAALSATGEASTDQG